jgi:hypothetical protein
MAEDDKLEIAPSLIGGSGSPAPPNSDQKLGTTEQNIPEAGGLDKKLEASDHDTLHAQSAPETKVNFGFLPVPRNCRITPTKPFKFNLAINILFGFACTFTVLPVSFGEC